MKFLLDHDVPDDLTYLLHELGHDVVPRLRAAADVATIVVTSERSCEDWYSGTEESCATGGA